MKRLPKKEGSAGDLLHNGFREKKRGGYTEKFPSFSSCYFPPGFTTTPEKERK